MLHDAVDPAQRQICERAHVEIDHRELLGAVDFRRGAVQAEARIVDDDRGLEAASEQLVRDACRRVRALQIGRDDDAACTWPRPRARFASRTISFSRRATSAISWPLRANTRASAAPMPTDAPVITVTGLKIDIAVAPRVAPAHLRAYALSPSACLAGNAAAQRDTVARGHPQQIGDAPHQVILEFVDAPSANTISHIISTIPRRPGFVERAVDQAGEMIEVDRLVLGERADIDQLLGRGLVEGETRLEQRMQLVALGRGHVAVDGRGVNQQRGGREAIIVFLESARVLFAAGQLRDKILQRIPA